MIRLNYIAALFFVALLLAPAAAFADDDAPYSPKIIPVDELIVADRFDSAPLVFPWDEISSDRVASRSRMDFEIIYDIDYDTARETLTENYRAAEDFVALQPGALRYTEINILRIRGLQLGDDSGRITVGHPDLEPTFTVDVEADGSRTRFVIQNSTRSRQFSGFVPARSDSTPIGADPIPFRWN